MDKNLINFDHLKEVNSGYFEHFIIAMKFSVLTLFASITALIHGIFPFLIPFVPYKIGKHAIIITEKYFKKKKVL